MHDPVDRYSAPLHRIVHALVAGDQATAEAAVDKIAFTPPAAVATRGKPAIAELAKIYERDRYQCRYCGVRTINSAVLELLSRRFPTQLPVHPHWKGDSTHPVYLLQYATNDHVQPVARGGDIRDPRNIVTACWPCNAAKADVPLEALNGWRLRDAADADPNWHGLADLHVPLWKTMGEPTLAWAARQWLEINRTLYAEPDDLPRE